MTYTIETRGKYSAVFSVESLESMKFWVNDLKQRRDVSLIRITSAAGMVRTLAYEGDNRGPNGDGWVGEL